MADNLRGAASSYRPGQESGRGDYGRGSSYEGGMAYEAYGRDGQQPTHMRERYYRTPRRDHDWRDMADSGTVWALGVGAGLGLLAGLLIPISGRSSGMNWQGESERSWPSRRTRRASSVATDETSELIASDKVEGTAVYDREGNKLGEVKNFMVGKRSGRVAYAVMSFGGLLGVGSSHYPLPWDSLDYDTEKGGYVVDLDKDRLSGAPSHNAGENGFSNPNYGRRVTEYWSVAG